jgi:hypothetical protein
LRHCRCAHVVECEYGFPIGDVKNAQNSYIVDNYEPLPCFVIVKATYRGLTSLELFENLSRGNIPDPDAELVSLSPCGYGLAVRANGNRVYDSWPVSKARKNFFSGPCQITTRPSVFPSALKESALITVGIPTPDIIVS